MVDLDKIIKLKIINMKKYSQFIKIINEAEQSVPTKFLKLASYKITTDLGSLFGSESGETATTDLTQKQKQHLTGGNVINVNGDNVILTDEREANLVTTYNIKTNKPEDYFFNPSDNKVYNIKTNSVIPGPEKRKISDILISQLVKNIRK